MNQRSEIDELFFRLMGYYPKKAGEAYEIISAAALGIIRDQSAEHNKYLQGLSGGRPYSGDEVPGVTFISDCLAAKTAQNKEKGAENGIKFALNSKNSCIFAN